MGVSYVLVQVQVQGHRAATHLLDLGSNVVPCEALAHRPDALALLDVGRDECLDVQTRRVVDVDEPLCEEHRVSMGEKEVQAHHPRGSI